MTSNEVAKKIKEIMGEYGDLAFYFIAIEPKDKDRNRYYSTTNLPPSEVIRLFEEVIQHEKMKFN